jgi:hypothetical protein
MTTNTELNERAEILANIQKLEYDASWTSLDINELRERAELLAQIEKHEG